MIITRLKSRNQVTIPKNITEKFDIGAGCLFSVEAEGNFIKLIPVDIEPRWTPEELEAIERLADKEKDGGVKVRPGREFSEFVDEITE